MRKSTMWFPNRFKFQIEAEECTIPVAKTKALISCTIIAQLICFFVSAYAKRWFSHNAAHLVLFLMQFVIYCFFYNQQKRNKILSTWELALDSVGDCL